MIEGQRLQEGKTRKKIKEYVLLRLMCCRHATWYGFYHCLSAHMQWLHHWNLSSWSCTRIVEVTLNVVQNLSNEKASQATIDDSFDNWTRHALINVRLRCFWLKDMVIRKGKVGNSMGPATAFEKNAVPRLIDEKKTKIHGFCEAVKKGCLKCLKVVWLHIDNLHQLLCIRKEQVCPSRPNWMQETSFSSLQLSSRWKTWKPSFRFVSRWPSLVALLLTPTLRFRDIDCSILFDIIWWHPCLLIFRSVMEI